MTPDLLHRSTAAPGAGGRLLHLAAGDLRLDLAPAVGGSIAGFRRVWREAGRDRAVQWLRPASEDGLAQRRPLAMASFPLVPFCNRIRDGRATFEGREIRLPPNHPAEDSPHALHGIGWQREWGVQSEGPDSAVLALEVDAGPAWPWRFAATQSYRLRADGLEVAITLTNQDTAAMPAGIGHHPYFLHEPGTRLTTTTRAMWEADGEVMPTGLAQTDVVRQLRQGALLADLHTDNNFTGWSREARIDWPADANGPARSLVLQAESPLDFFVLYCQRGYEFFCAEPVSQCTDWLNLAGRYGPEDLGGTRLAPGETLEARFRLTPRCG